MTDVPYHHLFTDSPQNLSDAEQADLAAGKKWQMEEGAYAMLQSTKPQTLACGLNDSCPTSPPSDTRPAKAVGSSCRPPWPFPKDLVQAPHEYAERYFNVQRWTEMPRGGHFAALEEPELLAADLRAFFRPLRVLAPA